jgi:phosphate starvation-inducible membrane PsiE
MGTNSTGFIECLNPLALKLVHSLIGHMWSLLPWKKDKMSSTSKRKSYSLLGGGNFYFLFFNWVQRILLHIKITNSVKNEYKY